MPRFPLPRQALRKAPGLKRARMLAVFGLAFALCACLPAPSMRNPAGPVPAAATRAGGQANGHATGHEWVRALRDSGDFDQSVAQANRLILSSPPDAQLFVERGLSFMAMGQRPRAEEDFEAALAINPRHLPALLAQGDLAFALEQPALAEERYTRAIAAAPGSALAYVNRGVARDELGRLDEAIADYGRALALDPKNAQAYANRGVARSQQGDVAGMCADYTRACALGACRRLTDARLLDYCPDGR